MIPWTDDDDHPVEVAQVEHEPTCPGPRITEHDTPRRRILTCTGCRAFVVLARVNRWRDRG